MGNTAYRNPEYRRAKRGPVEPVEPVEPIEPVEPVEPQRRRLHGYTADDFRAVRASNYLDLYDAESGPSPPLDFTPGQLDALGLGETHHEPGQDWRVFDRNPFEHPEQAFRRGVQQGAHRVYHALEQAGVLDRATLERIRHYYGIQLYYWRYAKRRRLGRRLNVDDAPWLKLRK